LKTCPGCGSIDSDSAVTCGMCGRSLEGVPSRTLVDAEFEVEHKPVHLVDVRPQKTPRWKGLLLIMSGGGVIPIGLQMIILSGASLGGLGLLGIFLILSGILLVGLGLIIIVGAVRDIERPRQALPLEPQGGPLPRGRP
jgi:uncharacterized membrane-anchored protein YitT (DUF2179 family)